MKAVFCFALFVATASASGIIGAPIGLSGISPLGLGLAQQSLLVKTPLVSNIGLASPVIASPLGLGLGTTGLGLGLGATKVVGGLGIGGLGLGGIGLGGVGLGGVGLGGLGLGLGGLPLGGQIISPLNSGLLIKK